MKWVQCSILLTASRHVYSLESLTLSAPIVICQLYTYRGFSQGSSWWRTCLVVQVASCTCTLLCVPRAIWDECSVLSRRLTCTLLYLSTCTRLHRPFNSTVWQQACLKICECKYWLRTLLCKYLYMQTTCSRRTLQPIRCKWPGYMSELFRKFLCLDDARCQSHPDR